MNGRRDLALLLCLSSLLALSIFRDAYAQQFHYQILFEDEPEFLDAIEGGVAGGINGDGKAEIDDKNFLGKSGISIKVHPGYRGKANIEGWGYNIVEDPAGEHEYRYATFAWKKTGGKFLQIRFNIGGQWVVYRAGRMWRGQGGIAIAPAPEFEWSIHTVDLVADLGPGLLTGIRLDPHDGEYANYDHIVLHNRPGGVTLADVGLAVYPLQSLAITWARIKDE